MPPALLTGRRAYEHQLRNRLESHSDKFSAPACLMPEQGALQRVFAVQKPEATTRAAQSFLPLYPPTTDDSPPRRYSPAGSVLGEHDAYLVGAVNLAPVNCKRIGRSVTRPAGARVNLPGGKKRMAGLAFPLRFPFGKRPLVGANLVLASP